MQKKRTLYLTLSLAATLAVALTVFLQTGSQSVRSPDQLSDQAPSPVYIPGSPHQSAHLPFEWAIYEDASRPEFWADGADGILPRPFLHLAAYPTTENAEKLVAWQKRQWETIRSVIRSLGGGTELDLFQELLGSDMIENAAKHDQGYQMATAYETGSKGKPDAPVVAGKLNWSKVGIVFIYRSSCGACRKAKPVIDLIKELGGKVYTFQVDHAESPPMFPDSIPYEGEWVEELPYNGSTPFYYIKVDGYEPQYADSYITLLDIKAHVEEIIGD